MMNSILVGRAARPVAAACLAIALAISHFAPHPFRVWAAVPFALIAFAVFFRSQASEATPGKHTWLVITIVLIMTAALLFILGGWFSMFRLLG